MSAVDEVRKILERRPIIKKLRGQRIHGGSGRVEEWDGVTGVAYDSEEEYVTINMGKKQSYYSDVSEVQFQGATGHAISGYTELRFDKPMEAWVEENPDDPDKYVMFIEG